MAKMLISQIIGGLSLFGRAVRQGGDEAKSFKNNIKALSMQKVLVPFQKEVDTFTKSFAFQFKNSGIAWHRLNNEQTSAMKLLTDGMTESGMQQWEQIARLRELLPEADFFNTELKNLGIEEIDGRRRLFESIQEVGEDGTITIRKMFRDWSELFEGIPVDDIINNAENLESVFPDLVQGLSKWSRKTGTEITEKGVNSVLYDSIAKGFANSPIGKLFGKDKAYKAETNEMTKKMMGMPEGDERNSLMDKIVARISPDAPELKGPGFKARTKEKWQGFKDLSGGDKAKGIAKGLLKAPIAIPKSLMSTPLKAAGKGFDFLGKGVSKLTGIPTSKLKAGAAMFKSAAMPMLGGMALGVLLDIAMQLLDAINPFKPLMEALTTIFTVFGAIMSQAFTPLIEKLFEILLGPETIALFEMLTEAVLQLIVAFLPVLQMLMPIFTAVMMYVIIAIQIFAAKMEMARPLLEKLGAAFEWFNTNVLWPLWNFVQNNIMPIFQELGEAIGKYFGMIVDAFGLLLEGDVAGFFAGIWTAIVGIFNSIINAITGMLNQIINAVNLILPAKWEIPTIPALANGGIVTKPTIALIGEAGPEEVRPLDDSPRGITINIHGDITERALFKLNRQLLIHNVY